jgi:Methyltransferase domain
MSIRRRLRNAAKGKLKGVFEFGQRFGVDVLPRHFYSSIPDFRDLRRDDRWREPYDMIGVAGADVGEQAQFLRQLMTEPIRQRLARGDVWRTACERNGEPGYGPTDADALFAFIHGIRPKRIVQIGCGVSTAVILHAAGEAAYTPRVLCVDPIPTHFLQASAHSKQIDVVSEKAEHVDPHRLADLNAGDLLFIDSSHTTKPGSDVHHLILRVLPRLKPGVYVHVHDVNFPYDFGPNILGPADLFFGVESVMLHAFLVHNPHARIWLSLSMLHHGQSKVLKDLLPNYAPVATDRGLNPTGSDGTSPSATYLLMQ